MADVTSLGPVDATVGAATINPLVAAITSIAGVVNNYQNQQLQRKLLSQGATSAAQTAADIANNQATIATAGVQVGLTPDTKTALLYGGIGVAVIALAMIASNHMKGRR